MSLKEQQAMLRQLSQRTVFQSLSSQVQGPILGGIKTLADVGSEMIVLHAVALAMVAYDTISTFGTEYKLIWPARWTASKVSQLQMFYSSG